MMTAHTVGRPSTMMSRHSSTQSSKSSFVDEDMMMEDDGDIPMMTTTTAAVVPPTTTTTTPYYNNPSTFSKNTRQVSPTNQQHETTYNNNPNHFSSSNSSVSSNTKLQQQARHRRRQRKQEHQQQQQQTMIIQQHDGGLLPHNNSGMTVQTDNYSTYNQTQNDEIGMGGGGPSVITPRENETSTTHIQQPQEDPSFDYQQQTYNNNNTYESSNHYDYPQQQRNPAIVPLSPPPISSTAYVEHPAPQSQPLAPLDQTLAPSHPYHDEQPPSLAPLTTNYYHEGTATDYYTQQQQQQQPQSNGYNNNYGNPTNNAAFAYDQGQDPSFPQSSSYYPTADATMTTTLQPAAEPTSASNTVASSPTTPYGYHHLHEHRSMESTPESRLGSGGPAMTYPSQADGTLQYPSLQPPMLHNAPPPYANDHHVTPAATTNNDDDDDSLFLTDNEGGDDVDHDGHPTTKAAAAKPKKKYSYNFEDSGQDKVLSTKGKKKKKPAAAGSSRSRRMQAAAAYQQQSQGTISSLSDHEGGYSGGAGTSRSLRRRQQLMSSHRQRRAAAQQPHGGPTEDDSSIDDPQPAPNRKKKTVSFSGARNTLYEYSDNEEDGTVDDTLNDEDDETRGDEDTLETGSQYSKDQHNDGYSVGSQTLNSEYTKSYESEVEDALKDFFMIGDGRKSKPGRRKRSEGPVVKKMMQKGQIRKSTDQRHKTSLAHVNPYRTTNQQHDHKRPPRASSRYHQEEDDKDDESTLGDANATTNVTKPQGRNNAAVATTKSRSKDEHDDGPTIEAEDDPTFDEGDEEEASRRMVESRASGAQSAAASAYTFGEDEDDETESMVSGLTNDKSAYEKKLATLQLEEATKKQQQGDEKVKDKKNVTSKSGAATTTTTDASVMDTLTALFHSAVHSCGLGSGAGAFPPSEVDVTPTKGGSGEATKTTTESTTTNKDASTPSEDNLLTQVQTQMLVMGVQCQEWLEQKTGCAVELWEKEEGAVVGNDGKAGGKPQDETNSKTTTTDAAEPDAEDLEKGLLASVQAAATTLHRLQDKVFDDSYDIDVTQDVEFVVVSASLPLGVLFEENAGGCFISKIFPGGATEFASVVQVGDQLTAIDGHSAVHQTVPQICSRMSTSPNPSHIELTFVRYVGPIRALAEEEVLRRQRLEEIQADRAEKMMDMSYAASSVGDMSSVGEQFWTKKKAGPPIDLKKLSEARALELQQQKAIATSDNAADGGGVEVSNQIETAAPTATTKPPSSLSSMLLSPTKKKPPTATTTTSILKNSPSKMGDKATTAKKKMSSLFKPSKPLTANTPTRRGSSNTPTRSVATTNSSLQKPKKSGGIKGLFKGGASSTTK